MYSLKYPKTALHGQPGFPLGTLATGCAAGIWQQLKCTALGGLKDKCVVLSMNMGSNEVRLCSEP